MIKNRKFLAAVLTISLYVCTVNIAKAERSVLPQDGDFFTSDRFTYYTIPATASKIYNFAIVHPPVSNENRGFSKFNISCSSSIKINGIDCAVFKPSFYIIRYTPSGTSYDVGVGATLQFTNTGSNSVKVTIDYAFTNSIVAPGSLNISVPPTTNTSSAPTASITIDGQQNLKISGNSTEDRVEDREFTLAWNSTAADDFSLTATQDPPQGCFSVPAVYSVNWFTSLLKNVDPIGSVKITASANNKCTLTLTFTAKNSLTGKSASSNATLFVDLDDSEPIPSTKFKVGQLVRTSSPVNMRLGPAYVITDTVGRNVQGKIISSPVKKKLSGISYWWWNISVDLDGTRKTGWVAENYLVEDTIVITQPPISTKFTTIKDVQTRSNVNARSTPGGMIVYLAPANTKGTVDGLPIYAELNGTFYWWWKVTFPNISAWVAEDYLIPSTIVPVVTTPTVTQPIVPTTPITTQPQNPVVVVVKNGSGIGTVAASGINCGTDCVEPVLKGSSITLIAIPTSESTFVGWSGSSGCTGTGPCTIPITANTVVTATFNTATTPVTPPTIIIQDTPPAPQPVPAPIITPTLTINPFLAEYKTGSTINTSWTISNGTQRIVTIGLTPVGSLTGYSIGSVINSSQTSSNYVVQSGLASGAYKIKVCAIMLDSSGTATNACKESDITIINTNTSYNSSSQTASIFETFGHFLGF